MQTLRWKCDFLRRTENRFKTRFKRVNFNSNLSTVNVFVRYRTLLNTVSLVEGFKFTVRKMG